MITYSIVCDMELSDRLSDNEIAEFCATFNSSRINGEGVSIFSNTPRIARSIEVVTSEVLVALVRVLEIHSANGNLKSFTIKAAITRDILVN